MAIGHEIVVSDIYLYIFINIIYTSVIDLEEDFKDVDAFICFAGYDFKL